MKKKIIILLCCIVVLAGAYFGFNIDFDVEETETENVIEEVEEIEETNEVIITEETEEIVRDTIQATEERRGLKYNRRD